MSSIKIGRKPVRSYILPVMAELMKNGSATIEARGMLIYRAVDVAEIVKRTNDVSSDVSIGSVELESDGKKRRISTISITLTTEE